MLTIEVFRPDEMASVLKQKQNKKTLKALARNNSQENDNPYLHFEATGQIN